jgi:hypothetical protein
MITLIVANVNISMDISPADLVFQVFITCGRKVIAVILPAVIPRISIAVIIIPVPLSRTFGMANIEW